MASGEWRVEIRSRFAVRHPQRYRKDEAKERVVVLAVFASHAKKKRRRNADRRKVEFCRALRVRPLPPPGEGAAHLSAFHRGSRPKESFIARDSAPGRSFLGLGGQG